MSFRERKPSFLVAASLGGAGGRARSDSGGWVGGGCNPLAGSAAAASLSVFASASSSSSSSASATSLSGAADAVTAGAERVESRYVPLGERASMMPPQRVMEAPPCDSDPELSDEDASAWEAPPKELLMDQQQLHIDKEGWLVKEGRFIRSWKKRWFVLQGDSLQYFTATNRKLKGTIKLESCFVRPAERKDKKECLELLTEGRKLYFLANDAADQQEWVIAINNKIASLGYERKAREMRQVPDYRVQAFFKDPETTSLILDESTSMILEALTALVDPLKYHAHLRVLSLNNCQLGAAGLVPLQLGLGGNCSVEDLDLGCNLLEGSPCGEGLAALLRKNRSITSLNLEQNALGDEGTVLLAEALEEHPLRVLNLTVNRIGDLGARAIGLVLQHRPDFPLERVQLANNLISDEGMPFLAEGIALNPRIVELQLQNNHLENQAAESIGAMLQSEKCKLHTLDLSFNRITLAGIDSLASAIKVNRTVTSLDLGGNRLSDQALVALMSADPLVYFEELELTRNDKRVTRAGSLLSMAGGSKPPPPPL